MRLVIFGILVALTSASLADERSDQAKQFFQEGMAKYHLDKWDEAILLFERGYETKPVAEFLFNIAQAHRFAGRPDKAVQYFKKFLALSPKSSLRTEIEQNIAKLKLEAEKQATTKPEPASTTQAAAAVEPLPPVSAPPPAAVVAQAPVAKPVHKRPWFGAVIGVSAVVVIGAVVAGVVVATQSSPFKDSLPTLRF